jgi:hypothetical protein
VVGPFSDTAGDASVDTVELNVVSVLSRTPLGVTVECTLTATPLQVSEERGMSNFKSYLIARLFYFEEKED